MVVFLMGKEMRIGRILIGAVLLALASVLLISGRYVLIKLLINMAAIKMIIKSNSMEKIITGTLYEYILSYAISKIFWTLIYIYRHGLIVCVCAVAIVAAVCVIYQIIRTKDNDNIYQVQITNQGISIDVKALYDTGNRLCDPISGRPVSVVEADKYEQLVKNDKPEKHKIIPYHTIGEEHGILEGTLVDKITIRKKDEMKILEAVIIACYKGKLSKDGGFQMILNKELL